MTAEDHQAATEAVAPVGEHVKTGAPYGDTDSNEEPLSDGHGVDVRDGFDGDVRKPVLERAAGERPTPRWEGRRRVPLPNVRRTTARIAGFRKESLPRAREFCSGQERTG
jgi:hypothetical protein